MSATEQKWAGRPAAEILADGVSSPAQVYCWRRARGESRDSALQQIIAQSGFSNPVNIEQLTRRCLAAEAREQERATAPKPQPKVLEAECLTYVALRTGGGMSPREAVDTVATRFRHGKVNRPLLEERLAEVERKRFPRPDVDVDAVAADAMAKLAELEAARVRLAPAALADGEVMAELEQVEHEIAACKRTLELVSLAQIAQQEKAAA